MAETATSVMKEGVDSVAEQMYTPQITGRAVRQSLFTISRAMRVRVAASTMEHAVSLHNTTTLQTRYASAAKWPIAIPAKTRPSAFSVVPHSTWWILHVTVALKIVTPVSTQHPAKSVAQPTTTTPAPLPA